MSVFSQRMATRLNRLSLPIVCSMRARSLYKRLGKKRPLCFEFSRRGITGVMPRARAAARLAWLSYPLSVIAMRGRISGPMSIDVSNSVLSLTCPPVR